MSFLQRGLAISLIFFSMIAMPSRAEVSANIGVTSNYVWRGVTQSDDQAAVSGGVDYEHDSGFFAGTWISNTTTGTGNETDLYVGFAGEMGDFGYGATYNYYMYSQAEDSDFGELLLDFSFSLVNFGLAYTVNDSALTEDEDTQGYVAGDIYYYLGLGTEIAQDWSWSASYGGYTFDNDASDNELNYSLVMFDVTKSTEEMGDLTLSASKILEDEKDVDLDDDIIFVVSWATSF
ncbi:MAG: hypothetical protein HRU20_14340 [Pseudomonadales bacterium]|nr:hypothetical protein [Pseudomonadales bacterium]